MTGPAIRRVVIEPDRYFDSVTLMRLSREVEQLPGVLGGAVVLGTDANKEALQHIGFSGAELEAARPTDLVIAVASAQEEAASAALDQVREKLARLARPSVDGAGSPQSLEEAVMADATNLALISVPGRYAAREAHRALVAGLHVMLFSDNVSVEDEIALKRLAAARGLLVMGPDCGTAIINGAPLGFANQVHRGPIGIVGASGTGIQEICCQIDRLGSGVSHAIGTGGRDLKLASIGGRTARAGIDYLIADPGTRVIVVVSKPPAPALATAITQQLAASGKPAVVHFLGSPPLDLRGSLRQAGDLTQAAVLAVMAATGERTPAAVSEKELDRLAVVAATRLHPRQRYVRGLFTGGTLAHEALLHLDSPANTVYSNIHHDPARQLADPATSKGHTVVDMGDDSFTVGKPHPMMDPQLRSARIVAEALDPQTAIVLLDVVLGYAAHPGPAGAVATALATVRQQRPATAGPVSVITSVTGTDRDSQGRNTQISTLEAAGCVVMPSNIWAARLVGRALAHLEGRA